MKITALSTVLCLATAALAADSHQRHILQNDANINSLEKRGGPKAVNRHENVHKTHAEHGVEAHKDGKHPSREDHGEHHDNEDDNDEDEDGDNGGGKDDNEEKKAEEGKKADNNKGGKKDGEKGNNKGDKKDDEKDGDKDGKKPVGKKGEPKDGKKDIEKAVDGEAKPPAKDAKDAKNAKDGKPESAENLPTSQDFKSPIWLVQPFGASVWEQGRDYVISWGPNPEPAFAKVLADKAPIDIRLMRGDPNHLKEVAVLKKGIDSSLHSLQWKVPMTLVPAKDYTVRLTHEGSLDTYSHYFEVVKAGDARSSKSNVGEPLELPKKGDVPMPLNKTPGAIIKPAQPPNPIPADATKPVTPGAPAPAPPANGNTAKPVAHPSAAESLHRQANILTGTLAFFGAVFFLG
ncbi:hypothetical protein BGW38_000061 [Lunasporangiospora selenospora]|uniref:Yeast cell wall synthesis Kre9/Knh1-like N-terminal domain-containing protein n=1 Tax=Lunasporangiospora selenospora TaxID=979761 RepID=A0A9P6FWA7_9FUNG|nr:hypothetical protein BGW38_000061 [Lunasporangiospora selenospora]